jgi:DNA repair protein RecN (Recombination protein N)
LLYSLSISNYALINALDIEFSEGLTIITGETGAGKSILLGALSLVLGQRADTGVLRTPAENAVVEACFHITGNEGDLPAFFEENELDYSNELLIRRVINPNGKSRAFINDQPVSLVFLKEVGSRVIDIHSQHENLLVGEGNYALRVVDAFAGLSDMSKEYEAIHLKVNTLEEQLKTLRSRVEQQQKELDYILFQYEQLKEAALEVGEQEDLEAQLRELTHAQEIRQSLFQIVQLLEDGQEPVLKQLRETSRLSEGVARFMASFHDISARFEQSRIELKDLANECDNALQRVRTDPELLEKVTRRLDLIYSLERKHSLSSVSDLVSLRDSLASRLKHVDEDAGQLAILENEYMQATELRAVVADRWHQARVACLDELSSQLKNRLEMLGMPHARVLFPVRQVPVYGQLGNTCMEVHFSANKDMPPRELSRVASGGEMSRLMLCIKSVVARHSGLSTIIFDEIDMGVSGRIADSMGNMIGELSKNMQVLAITHLPQVAAKGKVHFLVSKVTENNSVETSVKQLNRQERVMEVARMLSGSSITPAAVKNAEELLNTIL